MFATSFPDITAVASDVATLIAALIALGVTILGWKLGRYWIVCITAGDPNDERNYDPYRWDKSDAGSEFDSYEEQMRDDDPDFET